MAERSTRTHYVINKRFQLKYVTLLLAMTAVVCVVFAFTSNYFVGMHNIRTIAATEMASGEGRVESIQQSSSRELVSMLMMVFFCIAAVMALLGIYITHKMAGPIFALQRRMKEVATGNLKATIFKVRHGDEFQDLIETYNEMIFSFDRMLRGNEEKLKKTISLLNENIKKIGTGPVPPEVLKEFRGLLAELRGSAEPIKQVADKKRAA